MKSSEIVTLNGHDLTSHDLILVAREGAIVTIDELALTNVKRSQELIERKVAEGKIIYAVTTGFGANAGTVIKDSEEARELQNNLLRSHACGVGAFFPTDIVRAIMCIRLNTLLAGHSGIKIDTVTLLKDLLNAGIHPNIPSQGSVGSSGDLCPLSHMALVLIGEGDVEYRGQQMSATEALSKANLHPVHLGHKEGIALNNGTSAMTAIGCLAVYDAQHLFKLAALTASLSFEALCARSAAFDEKIHRVRKHTGQQEVASLIRSFIKDSTFIDADPAQVPGKKAVPQDAYSVRCTPQVLGASFTALQHVSDIIANELNAVVDNPIIFPDEDQILSGGNFHGEPVAQAMDYLKICSCEVANISERRTAKLLDPSTNDGLPAFLVEKAGLNSGFMIPQYVSAALVSENKVLAHPASVDSIPTSANTEDHVSMGTIAARQAREILDNVKKVLAIEMLTACQAIDLRKKTFTAGKLGSGTARLYEAIRKHVSFLEKDRILYLDIKAILDNFADYYSLM